MLHLLTVSCLLAAAAARTPYFYCNHDSTPIAINETDFYLVTRRPGESGYSAGLVCEFSSLSRTAAFFVEVESVRVSTAAFTISSGSRTLFSGSRIPATQSSIVTPSALLQVRFNATGDHSHKEGVRIRVQALKSDGCPPFWALRHGFCFGTSTTSQTFNFADAQKACISMRSNLLQLPFSYRGLIDSFVRRLPDNLKSTYTWIGLTDLTRAGRYKHYWLNGAFESSRSEIRCVSARHYLHYSCQSYERCGTFHGSPHRYGIYMDDCSDRNRFACSMPPGGASLFYSVPSALAVSPTSTSRAWVWAAVFGAMFIVGVIATGLYSGMRSNRMRRATTAMSATTSAGRVAVASPRPAAAASCRPPLRQPATASAPPYSAAAPPPSYDEAMQGGPPGNAGNSK